MNPIYPASSSLAAPPCEQTRRAQRAEGGSSLVGRGPNQASGIHLPCFNAAWADLEDPALGKSLRHSVSLSHGCGTLRPSSLHASRPGTCESLHAVFRALALVYRQALPKSLHAIHRPNHLTISARSSTLCYLAKKKENSRLLEPDAPPWIAEACRPNQPYHYEKQLLRVKRTQGANLK